MENVDCNSEHELLALAAKASGVKAQYSDNCGDFSIGEPYSREERRWNPLTDDADALKLAVKLDLHIRFYRKHVDVDGEVRGGGVISEDFQVSSRKNEAARLAIVRAAAEIGRSMA